VFSSTSLAALLLSACGDDLSRPYNPRPGYLASKSMKPVQVDLYRYKNKKRPKSLVGRLWHVSDQIFDEPPLSFKFPQAYYFAHPNHKGGAQSTVDIHFDMETLGPLPHAPFMTDYFRRPEIGTEKDREFRRRKATVQIKIVFSRPDMLKGPNWPAQAETERERVKKGWQGARDAAVHDGMKVVHYAKKNMEPFLRRTKNGHPIKNIKYNKPFFIGDVDIENWEIAAYPIGPKKKITQFVTCRPISDRCTGEFTYHGRALRFVVNNRHFADMDAVAEKIITLLDKYRLPPAKKGEY